MQDIGIALGLTAAMGLIAHVIADALRIPGILLYLLFGVLLGPAVLNAIPVGDVQAILPVLVPLAAAIILFEGGASLDLKAIRTATRPLQLLLTLGALINYVGAALLAWAVGGLHLEAALIFGSLMVVTGPTVVLPILRRTPLEPRLRALLHWEAILIDPIGVVLAVATLSYVLHRAEAGLHPIQELAIQLVLGSGIGAAIGFATSWLLHRPILDAPRHPERANVLSFAAALVAWTAGDMVVTEGGIAAATVAGLTLASRNTTIISRIRHFSEQVTSLLVASLFVLLAASVDPNAVIALGWRGVAVIVGVAVLVRPLAVMICTAGSDLDLRERGYLSWVGPKGIIAAAVAALSAIQMRAHGIPGGDSLEGLVFGTIAATVVAQGLTARPLSKALGLDQGAGTGLLVVGGALGQPLAEALHEHGAKVAVIDTNEEHVRRARDAGLLAVLGSALDRELVERVLDKHELGAVLALTPNEEVNALAAAVGREILGPKGALRAAVAGHDVEVRPLAPEDRFAFLEPLNVERAAEDMALGRVQLVSVVMDHGGKLETAGWRYPLFRIRGKTAKIVTPHLDYAAGDVLICFERRAGDDAEPTLEIEREAHGLGISGADPQDQPT